MVSTTNLLLGQQEEKLTLEYRDIAEGLEHLNEKISKYKPKDKIEISPDLNIVLGCSSLTFHSGNFSSQ